MQMQKTRENGEPRSWRERLGGSKENEKRRKAEGGRELEMGVEIRWNWS